MPATLFSPGPGELVLIFLILLLVFGARRLPQIGEGIGKAISGLKRGLNTNDDIEVSSDPKDVEAIHSGDKVDSKVSEKESAKKS